MDMLKMQMDNGCKDITWYLEWLEYARDGSENFHELQEVHQMNPQICATCGHLMSVLNAEEQLLLINAKYQEHGNALRNKFESIMLGQANKYAGKSLR
jgi:hypothetical protein